MIFLYAEGISSFEIHWLSALIKENTPSTNWKFDQYVHFWKG